MIQGVLPKAMGVPVKRLLILALGAALLLAGCTSGYTYVTNSKTKTYFKIPDQWHLFNENEIFASQIQGLSPQSEAAARQALWMVAFDSDPHPSLDHLFQLSTRCDVVQVRPTSALPVGCYPEGFAQVRPLSDNQRDSLSLATLRNSIFPVDQLVAEDPTSVEILQQHDIVLGTGFHGSRYVMNVKRDQAYLTLDQTVLVDPATRMLYLFVIGCEAHCYLDHQKTIDQIVKSWTVKER
jgi:hypothetical protein